MKTNVTLFAGSGGFQQKLLPQNRHNFKIKKGNKMNIDELTIGELKEIVKLAKGFNLQDDTKTTTKGIAPHPMLSKYCVIRTYSAGVHIGTVAWVNPDNSMEVKLTDALRLWKWEGGGLSLSAVANNGIKGGRLNRTGEVLLTNAIEYIPVADRAKKTYEKFIED